MDAHDADTVKQPSPQVSPDDSAAQFLGYSPSPLRYESENDDPHEVAALLAGMIPEGARVLDVGCGTGSVSGVIRRLRGAEIVGVEPDLSRVLKARSRGLTVEHGYLTAELVQSLGPFDAVVFADVLEHLPNPGSLLQLGCSALTPGGVVVMSVPNVAHWSIRWELLLGRFTYDKFGLMDATHLRWFTAQSLESWLQNNGLHVERMEHSAGTTLPIYYRAWPWRTFREDRRSALIRRLARWWPLLFGCQHIVRASRNLGQ